MHFIHLLLSVLKCIHVINFFEISNKESKTLDITLTKIKYLYVGLFSYMAILIEVCYFPKRLNNLNYIH